MTEYKQLIKNLGDKLFVISSKVDVLHEKNKGFPKNF